MTGPVTPPLAGSLATQPRPPLLLADEEAVAVVEQLKPAPRAEGPSPLTKLE